MDSSLAASGLPASSTRALSPGARVSAPDVSSHPHLPILSQTCLGAQPGEPPKPPAHCSPRDPFMSEHLPVRQPREVWLLQCCEQAAGRPRLPRRSTPWPAPRGSLAGRPHGWAPPRTRLRLLSTPLCCVPPSVPRPPCLSHVPSLCPRLPRPPPPPVPPATSAGRPGRASVPPAQAGVSPVHWQLTAEPARPPPSRLAETPGWGAGGGCRGRSRPRGHPHL